MGQAVAKTLASLKCGRICENCSKYVCNACAFHSRCCTCMEIDIVTEEVDVPDHVSELSVEVEDCCAFHSKT